MKHVNYSKIVTVCVCVCVFFLSGCKPDTTCRENTKVGLVCEIRHAWLDAGRQVQVTKIFDSITVVGIEMVEPLYNNSKKVQQLTLPLHNTGDSTQYALLYHKKWDTVCVYHSNTSEFINLECGCVVNHSIKSIHYTKHWMDSIAIIESGIHREGNTNVQLWRTRDVR